MVKVTWTQLARADLKSIHEFISRDSKTYADKFVLTVIERVTQLQTFPQSGRIVPEFNKEDIRELIEGSYRIVYKVYLERVSIVRIHHSARTLGA